MTEEEERLFCGLDAALMTLTEREQHMLWLRYYCGKKLREIGHVYNVDRERVRQIIAKAIRKLQHPSMVKLIIQNWEDLQDDPVKLPDFDFILQTREYKKREEWKKKQRLLRHRAELMKRKYELEEKLLSNPAAVTALWIVDFMPKFLFRRRMKLRQVQMSLSLLDAYLMNRIKATKVHSIIVDGREVHLNVWSIRHVSNP